MPDKGWNYLNSDDGNDTFINDDDSSFKYKNDDGSESYYGEDGSWGYKNTDGSKSYYGADGSWGYKNVDGSESYYGADGSWGYKNVDGSESYYESDKSCSNKNYDDSIEIYDSDNNSRNNDTDEYRNEEEDDNNWATGLVGLVLGIGAVVFSKSIEKAGEEARKEKERRCELDRIVEEKRHIRREKKNHNRKIRKKRLKALILNKKNIQLEFSTTDFVGLNYKEVLNNLEEAGFNNCKTIAVKDIYVGNNKNVGGVEQVVINGQSYVSEGTMVKYDEKIIVTYHLKREIEFPFDLRMAKKMTFEKVADYLLDLGYTEVYSLPIKELKTGWIKKENYVKQIVIDGVECLKKGIVFEYDKKITIQYYSFANK